MTDPIRAAGGVMVARDPSGQALVAVVHRPSYDDWTFPKGKLREGEGAEEAALREVVEETGQRCRLGRELGRTEYLDGSGRDKIVRYWLMTPLEGRFVPGREVDEVRWLSPNEAVGLLTHEHDRELLRELNLDA